MVSQKPHGILFPVLAVHELVAATNSVSAFLSERVDWCFQNIVLLHKLSLTGMTSPISPISAQALKLLPIAKLPIPSENNHGWIVRLRSDMRLYESDGTAWTDFVSGGAPPSGSISSTSPIIGNPPALDTPAEMAAAIQAQAAQIAALQAFDQSLDLDGDGNVDAAKQQSLIRPQTIVSDTWTINHNLNRHPPVLVRNSAGEPVTPNEVQYPTPNTMIITFGVPMSGTAEFI